MTQDLETLRDKIKDVRIAMLTTADGNILRARPMATQEMDTDGSLWFFTPRDSAKVDEVAQERQVCIAYANPSNETYVSVTGTAQVVVDQAKITELWSDIMKAWFPEGKNDPNLALLKVTPRQAEYWDHAAGKVGSWLSIAKSLLTGDGGKDMGRNEKLDNLASGTGSAYTAGSDYSSAATARQPQLGHSSLPLSDLSGSDA